MKFSSKKYAIKAKDLLKGLLMAAGTTVAAVLQKMLDVYMNGGELVYSWKTIAMAAAGAAATYIIRKFLVDDVKIAQKTIAENQ
jgi:hypothetical protein